MAIVEPFLRGGGVIVDAIRERTKKRGVFLKDGCLSLFLGGKQKLARRCESFFSAGGYFFADSKNFIFFIVDFKIYSVFSLKNPQKKIIRVSPFFPSPLSTQFFFSLFPGFPWVDVVFYTLPQCFQVFI